MSDEKKINSVGIVRNLFPKYYLTDMKGHPLSGEPFYLCGEVDREIAYLDARIAALEDECNLFHRAQRSIMSVANVIIEASGLDAVAAGELVEARFKALEAENAGLKKCLLVIPPARLRMLAAWIDIKDKFTERGDEVQRDLRKLALAIEEAGAFTLGVPKNGE